MRSRRFQILVTQLCKGPYFKSVRGYKGTCQKQKKRGLWLGASASTASTRPPNALTIVVFHRLLRYKVGGGVATPVLIPVPPAPPGPPPGPPPLPPPPPLHFMDVYDEEMYKYVDLLDELGHFAIKWHNC
jgi:hypothetical protein